MTRASPWTYIPPWYQFPPAPCWLFSCPQNLVSAPAETAQHPLLLSLRGPSTLSPWLLDSFEPESLPTLAGATLNVFDFCCHCCPDALIGFPLTLMGHHLGYRILSFTQLLSAHQQMTHPGSFVCSPGIHSAGLARLFLMHRATPPPFPHKQAGSLQTCHQLEKPAGNSGQFCSQNGPAAFTIYSPWPVPTVSRCCLDRGEFCAGCPDCYSMKASIPLATLTIFCTCLWHFKELCIGTPKSHGTFPELCAF